jgi:hypothetical protein
MNRQANAMDERCMQFIPAQPGWLALFEESTPEGTAIHAEPVIAWCLGARSPGDHVGPVSFGQAVVGAGPWVDKADPEQVTHFFALVREEQLEPELLAELRRSARHSREHILSLAERNREERRQGHASWIRDRRTMLRSIRLQRRAMTAS